MALAGAIDILSWTWLFWASIVDPQCDWRNADETLLKLPPAFSALPPSAGEDPGTTTCPQNVHDLLRKTDSRQKHIVATDCKSLFDLISRTAPPACGEFRTLLHAKLIREHLDNGVLIRWVPSAAQMADALTKVMSNDVLREFLQQGRYKLHDEDEMLRSRSDARARLKWIPSQSTSHQSSSPKTASGNTYGGNLSDNQ